MRVSRFWREGLIWMVVGAIAAPTLFFVLSGEIKFAIIWGIPVGVFGFFFSYARMWRIRRNGHNREKKRREAMLPQWVIVAVSLLLILAIVTPAILLVD